MPPAATIRLALPKGRIFDATVAALRAAGYRLPASTSRGGGCTGSFPRRGSKQ